MGFTVYATASLQHHEYIKSLGATRVFDYKSENVLAEIVDAAKADGVTIRVGYHATGSQQLAADVMSNLRHGTEKAKLTIAPLVDPDLKVPEGVEAAFIRPPQGLEARNERLHWIFGTWLQGKLAAKEIVASPRIKVLEGGLASANQALEEWKAGVSCLKIVVEL